MHPNTHPDPSPTDESVSTDRPLSPHANDVAAPESPTDESVSTDRPPSPGSSRAITWSVPLDLYHDLATYATSYGLTINATVIIACLFGHLDVTAPDSSRPSTVVAFRSIGKSSDERHRIVMIRLPPVIYRTFVRVSQDTTMPLTRLLIMLVATVLPHLPPLPQQEGAGDPTAATHPRDRSIRWRMAPDLVRRVDALTAVTRLPVKALVVLAYLITTTLTTHRRRRHTAWGSPIAATGDKTTIETAKPTPTAHRIVRFCLPNDLITVLTAHAHTHRRSRNTVITEMVRTALPVIEAWVQRWEASGHPTVSASLVASPPDDYR